MVASRGLDELTVPGQVFVRAVTSDPPGRMEAIGLPMPPEEATSPTSGLSFVGETLTGEALGVLVQVARFWHADIAQQYLELRRQSDTTSLLISVHGLEHPWRQADIMRLLRSAPLIGQLINRGGRPPRTAGGIDHEEWLLKAREMREQRKYRLSPAAIAKRHGVDGRTVKRWLRWLAEEEAQAS